jgi:hypothetical protein
MYIKYNNLRDTEVVISLVLVLLAKAQHGETK